MGSRDHTQQDSNTIIKVTWKTRAIKGNIKHRNDTQTK